MEVVVIVSMSQLVALQWQNGNAPLLDYVDAESKLDVAVGAILAAMCGKSVPAMNS